jgi:hypothetical protein
LPSAVAPAKLHLDTAEAATMFSIGDGHVRSCDGLTRREWLRVGALGPALTLTDLVRGRQPPGGSFGRAKSCILCFLFGAPAHQDVWDLKPDAPREVRGEFRPIHTTVTGMHVGEHIPRVAAAARHYAILRSVAHADNTHTVAMHHMLSGRRHARPNTNPRNAPDDFPCFGAVVRHLRAGRGALPAGISLNSPANQVSAANHIFPGFFAGILGGGSDPLFIPADPSAAGFRPFAADGADDRLGRRRSLLAEVDARRRRLDAHAGFDAHQRRALDLVTSPGARRAFDLSEEPARLRDRYGWSPFGQGCLLARRLVEAGVRLVTVNWARDDAFWDTHANNFKELKDRLLPPFDRGFSALLEDLHARGLLGETLVVCLGEFGRTPKINGSAGRDHWAACNSVVLAGGGVRGGRVHGASDRQAAYPMTPPVSPDDLAATVYHALGIDPHLEFHDRLGRPWALTQGRVVRELF